MGNLGVLIVSLFQSVILFFSPNPPPLISPVWGMSFREEMTEPEPIATNSSELQYVVFEALSGTSGEYRIFIKHLPSGESFAQNENEVIPAGSLYKVWLAVGIMGEIRGGRLKENKVLSETIEALNKWAGIDPEDAELVEGMATFTVSEALKQMIAVSHNYSAYLLTKEIQNKVVQGILRDHGLLDSHYSRPPTVSAKDMALFFEKVYRDEFFPDDYSLKLKVLLAGNKLNDGLPKLLPPGTRVEHKTGELNDFKHDCGIVYAKQGDYIICVMTETSDPKEAEKRIALLSKAVFDYFAKQ